MAEGKKILVIDDDRSIHAAMKAVLEPLGYRIFSALDALQGPMVVRQVNPDLVILDISMPAGGGYAVYERLKFLSGTFHIPVLIYSVSPREEIAKKIPESGDTRILSKPARPDQIVEAVSFFFQPPAQTPP